MKLIAAIFFLFLISSCDFSKKSEKEFVGPYEFTDLSELQLLGVVTSKNGAIGNGFHGRGILSLEILNSTISCYDVRKKQANYFCIIKNNKAEIYEDNLGYINIGDTIKIDLNKKHKNQFFMEVYNNSEPFKMSISIYQHRNFFEFIESENLQKL